MEIPIVIKASERYQENTRDDREEIVSWEHVYDSNFVNQNYNVIIEHSFIYFIIVHIKLNAYWLFIKRL